MDCSLRRVAHDFDRVVALAMILCEALARQRCVTGAPRTKLPAEFRQGVRSRPGSPETVCGGSRCAKSQYTASGMMGAFRMAADVTNDLFCGVEMLTKLVINATFEIPGDRLSSPRLAIAPIKINVGSNNFAQWNSSDDATTSQQLDQLQRRADHSAPTPILPIEANSWTFSRQAT